MENLALVGLVENLKPAIAESVIRRVVQPQPNGFIFQTRSVRLPAFKVVVDPRYPALYASESRPPIESPNTDFLMILRKHLTSAELVQFNKPLSERIIEFVFKTAVPSRELETMSLVVELLPNAPNLILLDAERRVLFSFVPVSPQHQISEYEANSFPKTGGKIDLERIVAEDVPELDSISPENPQAWLIANVAGIGPVFAAEIVHRQKKTGRSTVEEIRMLVTQVKSTSRGAWLYSDLPLTHILETNDLRRLAKAILSPVPLESLERSHSSKVFANILEAARFYFDEVESRFLLDHAKRPEIRKLRDVAGKLSDREKRLTREQQKLEEASGLHKVAQLLTSSGMRMDQHYEAVAATDYFSEKPQQINIDLDSTLTLRENIDRMFKRHAKAGRGNQVVAQQLAEVRRRRDRIDEQVRRLLAIKDWDTWLAIAARIDQERQNPDADATDGTPPRNRYRSIQVHGREILVGRSGRENDELTFQVATPDDFWLHVADYSGSHVVVRNPNRDKELDPNVLTKAAQLAAYFSQARNSSKVEVHYTRRKHVLKAKRSKPGTVRLLEFKSISVEPKNWLDS